MPYYLSSTFRTLDIKLLNPKFKLNVHLTKTPKRDLNYNCVYTCHNNITAYFNILICSKAEM